MRGGWPVRATDISCIDIDTGDHANDGRYRPTSPTDIDVRADPDQRTDPNRRADANPKAQ